jgi:hypothetical protein
MTSFAEFSTDICSLLQQAVRNAWEWDPAAFSIVIYAVLAMFLCVLAMYLARQDNAPSRRRWAEGPRPSAGQVVVKYFLALTMPLAGFVLLRFLCR